MRLDVFLSVTCGWSREYISKERTIRKENDIRMKEIERLVSNDDPSISPQILSASRESGSSLILVAP